MYPDGEPGLAAMGELPLTPTAAAAAAAASVLSWATGYWLHDLAARTDSESDWESHAAGAALAAVVGLTLTGGAHQAVGETVILLTSSLHPH